MRRSLPTCLALLAAATLVAAGCGGSDELEDLPLADGSSIPRDVSVPASDTRITKGLGDSATVLEDAGCSFGTYKLQDQDLANYHVPDDQLAWKTNPPSSGRHVDDWLAFGVYDEQVPDGPAVHNLEHGGVIVWLGSGVEDPLRTAIEALPKQDEKWIVSPRTKFSDLVSVAWGQGLACPAESLSKLSTAEVTTALGAWYDIANSQGAPGEKDIPAYAGGAKDPKPVRDISTPPPG